MLGAAHAAANPLTARLRTSIHGVAVGLMLPHVIRLNSVVCESLYRELWPAGGESLAERVEAIRTEVGLPVSLGQVGVAESDIPALAAAAGDEWTGGFNPRSLDRTAFEALYATAL